MIIIVITAFISKILRWKFLNMTYFVLLESVVASNYMKRQSPHHHEIIIYLDRVYGKWKHKVLRST